jgi:hypothetical protein
MNMRNLLKPGEYVYPVPIGALMTLQYNVNGNLEKVYSGIENDRTDRTQDLMIFMIQQGTVPPHLKISGGTTFVLGVLYTGDILFESADAKKFQENILVRYKKTPDKYNFFAFSIDCTATRISGALSMQSTLAMNGFKHLTAVMTPANPTDQTVKEWLTNAYWTFIQNICMGFFRISSELKFEPVQFMAGVIVSVEKSVTENGAIMAKIKLESGIVLPINYSEYVNRNLHPKDYLLIDYNNEIAFVHHHSSRVTSRTLTCDFCGKVFQVSGNDEVRCPDPHCMSNTYHTMQNFLRAMGLPTMEYTIYKGLVDRGELTALTDVLLLDPYKDAEIQTSISGILRALIPVRLIQKSDILIMMESAVMNKIKTLLFYVDHPDKIGSDLGINHHDLNRLVTWISDGGNASDLKTILLSKQIKIAAENRQFNGAPILRTKKICITGLFVHGDYADIIGILRSYAANVVTSFESNVDCILVGDTGEEVDGQIIRAARSANIPIFYENSFFKHYDIDSDLQTLYNR